MEQVRQIPRLADRPRDAHKGLFGRVLIVAGSRGMSGAAALAGRAALRSGAGLVRVATPAGVGPIVAGLEPCYTTIPLAEDDQGRMSSRAVDAVLDAVLDNDVVAFGPGVGQSPGVRDVLGMLLARAGLALVIDADGLNSLARRTDWPERRSASVLLTPHPGEMRRLWQGLFREPVPAQREEQACLLAQRCACTVVLKGAGTVVTDASRFYINTTGNPGMATAGAGDVLTGMLAALWGQGLGPFEAGVLGTYVHGRAGDLALRKTGPLSLTATDILEHLAPAFLELHEPPTTDR